MFNEKKRSDRSGCVWYNIWVGIISGHSQDILVDGEVLLVVVDELLEVLLVLGREMNSGFVAVIKLVVQFVSHMC
jgi:hypothetical protein